MLPKLEGGGPSPRAQRKPQRKGPVSVPEPEVAVGSPHRVAPQRGPQFGVKIGPVLGQVFGRNQRERRAIVREEQKRTTAQKLRRASRVLDSAGRRARHELAHPSSPELRNAYVQPREAEAPDAAERDITRLRGLASDRRESMSRRLAALRVLRTRHQVPLANPDYLRSVGAQLSVHDNELARATVEGAVKAGIQSGDWNGLKAPSVQKAMHQLAVMPASPEAIASHRSWASNLFHDVEDTAAGLPAATFESLRTSAEGYRNLARLATGSVPSAGQMQHGQMMGEAIAHDDPLYGLVTGGFGEFVRRAHNHPLQAALDVSGVGKALGKGANVAIAGKLRGAEAAVTKRAALRVEQGDGTFAVHRSYASSPVVRGLQKGAEALKRAQGEDPNVATGARAERLAKRQARRVAQREEAATLEREGRIRKIYHDVTKRQLRKRRRAVDGSEERAAALTLMHRGSVRAGSELEDLRAIEGNLRRLAPSSDAAAHNLRVVEKLRRDAEREGDRALVRDPRLHAASTELRDLGRALDEDLASYDYLKPAQAVKRRAVQGPVDRGELTYREKGDRFSVERPSRGAHDGPSEPAPAVHVEHEAPAQFTKVEHGVSPELRKAERDLWGAHEQIRRAKAEDVAVPRPVSPERLDAMRAEAKDAEEHLASYGVKVGAGRVDVGEVLVGLPPGLRKHYPGLDGAVQHLARLRERIMSAEAPPLARRRALPKKRVRELEARLRAARQAVKDAGGDPKLVLEAHRKRLYPDELRSQRAAAAPPADPELETLQGLRRHALEQGDHRRAQVFLDSIEALHEERAGGRVAVAEAPEGAQAAPRPSSERTAPQAGFYDRHGNLVKGADLPDDHAVVYTGFERQGEARAGQVPTAHEGFTGASQLEQRLGDKSVLATLAEQQRRVGMARLVDEWRKLGPTRKPVPREQAERMAVAAAEHNGMRYELLDVGEGQALVVPTVVREVWQRQVGKPGRLATLSRWLTRNFVGAVLPFSVMWHAGNQVDMLSRLALSGVRLRDLERGGPEVLREFERVLGDADPHLRDAVLAWVKGHAGTRAQIEPVRIRDATVGLKGGLEQLGNALSGTRQIPGLKQLLDAGAKAKDSAFDAAAYLEGHMTRAAAGIALRDLGKALGYEIHDQVELARRLVDDVQAKPELVEEFARRTIEIIGDYRKSPLARDLGAVLPFYNWMKSALRFTLHTLPAKHPLAMAALSEAVLLTEQARMKEGSSLFFSKDEIRRLNEGRPYEERYPLPGEGYLAGAVGGAGSSIAVAPFTSFGELASLVSDPVRYVAEKPFPMLQGPIAAALGRQRPLGQDAVEQLRGGPAVGNGSLYGVSRGEMFASRAIESFVPGGRVIHKARRKGGMPLGDSTIFHPHDRRSTEVGVLPAVLSPVNPSKGVVKEVVTDLPSDKKKARKVKLVKRIYDPTSGTWRNLP